MYLVTLWHIGAWVRSWSNGVFLTKRLKNKIKMPNGWRTIESLVHKIRLHSRRGKGMAESFSREKLRHAPQKEGGWKILCDLPPVWPRLVRPTNLMTRMNGKKTHTHTRIKHYSSSSSSKWSTFSLYHRLRPAVQVLIERASTEQNILY